MSDEDLLNAISKDDTGNCLSEFYGRYRHLVLGVCIKYMKDTDDAKDIAMQVFEKLILTDFTEVLNAKAWLYTVARNQCLMALRKKDSTIIRMDLTENKDRMFMESKDSVHPYLNNHAAEKEEELQRLERKIEMLEPKQKICIELFYLKNKCYKEIEEITGYSLNNVKSYIQNGKRNLKLLMIASDE